MKEVSGVDLNGLWPPPVDILQEVQRAMSSDWSHLSSTEGDEDGDVGNGRGSKAGKGKEAAGSSCNDIAKDDPVAMASTAYLLHKRLRVGGDAQILLMSCHWFFGAATFVMGTTKEMHCKGGGRRTARESWQMGRQMQQSWNRT